MPRAFDRNSRLEAVIPFSDRISTSFLRPQPTTWLKDQNFYSLDCAEILFGSFAYSFHLGLSWLLLQRIKIRFRAPFECQEELSGWKSFLHGIDKAIGILGVFKFLFKS